MKASDGPDVVCTVTERANQARDHLLKKDLAGFDG